MMNRTLYVLSSEYIDVYRGFSYRFDENGEKELLECLAKTFHTRVTFFDVGANIGNWSAQAISFFKEYEGHLFEMAGKTYDNLYCRYKEDPAIHLNNVALSDKNKETLYRDYGENDGRNTLLVEANYHKRDSCLSRAECVRGDAYCLRKDIERINILKIDAEGNDFFVLQGFDKLLAEKAIDVIQFEYGYTHADVHTLMKDFYNLLEGYGYVLGPLRKAGVRFKRFSYSDNEFKSGPNYVACLPQFAKILLNFGCGTEY